MRTTLRPDQTRAPGDRSQRAFESAVSAFLWAFRIILVLVVVVGSFLTLTSGKYGADTTFAANDHRTYNRRGEAFDRGETFSGVDFEEGLAAVAELSAALPEGVSLPAATLAWIASRPGVTSVIPGARSVAQAAANADAAALLDSGFDLAGFDAVVRDVYDRRLRDAIHPQW